MIRPIPFLSSAIRSLPAGYLLLSAAVGFLVLSGLALLTLIPLALVVAGFTVWILSTLLIGWAGIEGLAACERWMEANPRFQR